MKTVDKRNSNDGKEHDESKLVEIVFQVQVQVPGAKLKAGTVRGNDEHHFVG